MFSILSMNAKVPVISEKRHNFKPLHVIFFLKHILPLSANNIKAEIFRQRRKIYESNRYRPENR